MKKIFSYQDEANCAYLLKSGSVFFEIKEGERYKISGKNLIVAAGEVILNFDPEVCYYRVFSLYKDDDAELARISPDTLKKLVSSFDIGFNINIFFAKLISMTNKILAKRQSGLTDDAKTVQEISKAYFDITNMLVEFAKKTKFPDVIELSEKHKSELIFETGKIFSQQKAAVELTVKKEKLDEFNISFEPGSVICNQGEEGLDMYILNQGKIDVFINDNQVAEIDKPGTVIGEIALILGEKRSATLKAADQVLLSVIKKENLKSFHQTHETIFLELAQTLSKRINHNFEMIHNIDKQNKEKSDQKIAGFLTKDRAETYLVQLNNNVSDLYNEKRYEQLEEIMELAEKSTEKFSR